MSDTVKITQPEAGKSQIRFIPEKEGKYIVTLIYTQDITGLFLNEFMRFLNNRTDASRFVLPVCQEDGVILLIGGGDKFFTLDERTGELHTFNITADEFIEACCNAFRLYTEDWAKFDTFDAPSDTPYLSDYTEHEVFIIHSIDEIRQYYIRND